MKNEPRRDARRHCHRENEGVSLKRRHRAIVPLPAANSMDDLLHAPAGNPPERAGVACAKPKTRRMRRVRPANPMPESPNEVLALFAGAMVAASLFVVSTGALTPALQSSFSIPQSQIGLILSIQMIGSMLATALAGALTDRFGDRAIVLWTGWIMGIALICASLIHNFAWLLLWLAIYGIGYAAVTPAGSHAIVFFFKREDRGFAMGVRQCGVPLAGVIGSAILPGVALHFGYRWSLIAAGIITIAACSAASLLYRQPVELQGERISVRAMLAEMLHVSDRKSTRLNS